jgi:hypothetical protein
MNNDEQKILEDILESNGDCFHWEKCRRCPFIDKCLPKIIQDRKSMLSKNERLNLALERLFSLIILEDNTTKLDYDNLP